MVARLTNPRRTAGEPRCSPHIHTHTCAGSSTSNFRRVPSVSAAALPVPPRTGGSVLMRSVLLHARRASLSGTAPDRRGVFVQGCCCCCCCCASAEPAACLMRGAVSCGTGGVPLCCCRLLLYCWMRLRGPAAGAPAAASDTAAGVSQSASDGCDVPSSERCVAAAWPWVGSEDEQVGEAAMR